MRLERRADEEIQLSQIKQGRMVMKAMVYVGQREVEYKLIKLAYDACSK